MIACNSETPHENLVKLLVQSGADINLKRKLQKTALMCAAERGHTSIVKYLLDEGAQGMNKLGHTKVVRALNCIENSRMWHKF